MHERTARLMFRYVSRKSNHLLWNQNTLMRLRYASRVPFVEHSRRPRRSELRKCNHCWNRTSDKLSIFVFRLIVVTNLLN